MIQLFARSPFSSNVTAEKEPRPGTTRHTDDDHPRDTAEVCLYTTSPKGRPLTLTRTPEGHYALRGSRRGEIVVSTRSASMQLWPDYCADADTEAPEEDAVPVAIEDETTSPIPRMIWG
jgi:hypothetical protein